MLHQNTNKTVFSLSLHSLQYNPQIYHDLSPGDCTCHLEQHVVGNGHNPIGPEVLCGLHASDCKCHFLLYNSYLYQQLRWILHPQIPRNIVKAYQNDNFKV